MLRYGWINDLAAVCLEGFKGPDLIHSHQTAIARDVTGQNGRQPSLYSLASHGSRAVASLPAGSLWVSAKDVYEAALYQKGSNSVIPRGRAGVSRRRHQQDGEALVVEQMFMDAKGPGIVHDGRGSFMAPGRLRYSYAASGGIAPFPPAALCHAMPARQSRASSKWRPTIWKPSGEPLASRPAGRVMVG